jgi:hypothetical protein
MDPLAPRNGHPVLAAYQLYDQAPMRLVAASQQREWMDLTRDRFAYRCLPLLIANQAGWFVVSEHEVRAVWDGGDEIAAMHIDVRKGPSPAPALSHFGHGILTWSLPWLFRTSPGWNLLCRGPANWPKHGATPLEGVIETDWSVASFTMNWLLSDPGVPVTFEPGEPICMLVPQRRGELETFAAETHRVDWDSDFGKAHKVWAESRKSFNAGLRTPGSEAQRRGWERDYFRGGAPGGEKAGEHQMKLQLQEFPEIGKG